MASFIIQLLETPFSTMTLKKQRLIVQKVPPHPIQLRMGNELKTFNVSLYRKFEWLTACPILDKCFCWPCLLFSDVDGPWNRKGFCSWNTLWRQLPRHEKSAEHIDAELKLKLFYHQHVRKPGSGTPARGGPTPVKSRAGVGALIDAVCNEIVLQPILQKKDHPGVKSADKYLELIESFKDNFPGNTLGWDEAANLVRGSPQVVDEVINAMALVLKREIRKEAESAQFVSIVLGIPPDVFTKRLLFTVLRYTHGTVAHERLVRLTDKLPKTAEDTIRHINEVLREFGVEGKLLGYAFDGLALEGQQMSRFINIMKTRLMRSYFSPWHCHQFNDVLLQSLSDIKDVDTFVKAMLSLKRFLQKDSKPLLVLDEFLKLRKKKFHVEGVWCEKNDVVRAVLQYRLALVDYFNHIIQKPAAFRTEDVARAYGLRRYLGQFKTVFLLHLFATVSEAAPQFVSLSKSPKAFLETVVSKSAFKKELERIRDTEFEPLMARVSEEMRPPADRLLEYRHLFNRVLEKLVLQTHLRLGMHQELRFSLPLLRTNMKADLSNQSTMFWELLRSLRAFFPDERVIYDELQSVLQSDFSYSMKDLFKAFVTLGIRESAPSLFRLAELCYTLPLHANTGDAACNKDDVIRKWASGCEDEAGRARAVLGVEAKLLYSLKNRADFKERVFEELGVPKNVWTLHSVQQTPGTSTASD